MQQFGLQISEPATPGDCERYLPRGVIARSVNDDRSQLRDHVRMLEFRVALGDAEEIGAKTSLLDMV